jgi:hypothetical protein
MLVCAGCIQEGDEAATAACVSGDVCARCGAAPQCFDGSSVVNAAAPHLFRVKVFPPSTLDLAGSQVRP